MASIQTKFRVGLFVIIGFSVIVTAIIWLGVTNYLEKGRFCVIYFDESVQGLDRDAPVKYRGVTIGRVHRIQVAPDDTLIEVVVQIDEDLQLVADMVAQLKSVGITGIMFIELDRRRFREPDLTPRINFKPQHTVIGSRPSEVRRLFEGVEGLIVQMQNMHLDRLSGQMGELLELVQQTVIEIEFKQLSEEARVLMGKVETAFAPNQWEQFFDTVAQAGVNFTQVTDNAHTTLAGIDAATLKFYELIDANQGNLNDAVEGLQKAMRRVDTLMAGGTELVGHTEERMQILYQQLLITLENLEKASDHLNRFMSIIADQPSQIVFGEPMPERRAR